jgi:hypothetical protein
MRRVKDSSQRKRAAYRPWTPDDLCTLSDALADGFPRRAVAQKLGRSVHAVQGMARKIGIRIRRGPTVAYQIQLDHEINHYLALIARRHGVTIPTMIRLMAEVATRTPVWIEQLFDVDAAMKRNDERS